MDVIRPEPATRPANRRALVVAAATRLFADRGFENVAMSDIADAVAVGPSALYRYFPGKVELLATAIGEVLSDLAQHAATAESVESVLGNAAVYAVDHRLANVLWQREARHLPVQTQTALREQLRMTREGVARAIASARPGLNLASARVLAVAALAAIFSPSLHHISIERPGFESLLVELAGRVLSVDVPATRKAPRVQSGLRPASRREEVISSAMRLFAERTYASVGVEEIAAAAGIAPSSVYSHFSGKREILWVALQRGTGYLQLTLDEVLSRATDEAGALRHLVEIYSAFALNHAELVDALITEVRSLRPDERELVTKAQRGYVSEWVHLYRGVNPQYDAAAATVVVQAALSAINDLVRTASFRQRDDAVVLGAAVAQAILGLT